MIIEVQKKPFTTAADLYKNEAINHKNASERTIQRLLNKAGLKARIPQSTLHFSEDNLRKRLNFAEEKKDWITDKWK